MVCPLFAQPVISIHTLRMEGDWRANCGVSATEISIHTLRMEGDGAVCNRPPRRTGFQSTPSAWRVTMGAAVMPSSLVISIHTLRMEGDSYSPGIVYRDPDFNPHPPHGG